MAKNATSPTVSSTPSFVIHVNEMARFPDAVYIGRATRKHPKGSILGNPFRIGVDGTRSQCVQLYRDWLPTMLPQYPATVEALIELRSRPIACWCRKSTEEIRIGNACHGDVIIELLDRYSDDELRALSKAA